jgi:hypothetical protein
MRRPRQTLAAMLQSTIRPLAAVPATAGAAELGNVGIDKANPKADTVSAYQEAITINADTGIPLGLTGGPAGGKVAVSVTYVVTRVKLADIATGKF